MRSTFQHQSLCKIVYSLGTCKFIQHEERVDKLQFRPEHHQIIHNQTEWSISSPSWNTNTTKKKPRIFYSKEIDIRHYKSRWLENSETRTAKTIDTKKKKEKPTKKKYLPMLLLTTAPLPSLWGFDKTFFTTNLGLSNAAEFWPDADIIFLKKQRTTFWFSLFFPKTDVCKCLDEAIINNKAKKIHTFCSSNSKTSKYI